MCVNSVPVVLDDPVADPAFKGRGLDLTTAVLILVLAPLQVVLGLERKQGWLKSSSIHVTEGRCKGTTTTSVPKLLSSVCGWIRDS